MTSRTRWTRALFLGVPVVALLLAAVAVAPRADRAKPSLRSEPIAVVAQAPAEAAPAVSVPGTVAAVPSVARPAVSKPAPAQMPAASFGMRAAIDPETGRLTTPTPEQRRELELEAQSSRIARPETDLPVITLSDGTQVMHLDGRYMETEVARIGADGKVHFGCVHGERTDVPAAACDDGVKRELK